MGRLQNIAPATPRLPDKSQAHSTSPDRYLRRWRARAFCAMKPLVSFTAAVAALCSIGCAFATPKASNAVPPARGAAASASTVVANGAVEAPRFLWPGSYDLLGDNFPEGLRAAILTIVARDSSYDFYIEGPPGTLKESKLAGDSAHVVWDMFGEPMYVDLRGVADSLDGHWRIGDRSGHVWGTRRR